MKYMDKLPTVISCCFCCFLRAGTVMIAVVSFIAGLFLAPNVNNSRGPWDMNGVLMNTTTGTEATIQMILGIISILLCIISFLLLIGALCNCPTLIEIYQWGVLLYSVVIFVLFTVLSLYCIIVHGDCIIAGSSLLFMMVCNLFLTLYFVLVVNSLRMSILYLDSDVINICNTFAVKAKFKIDNLSSK